MDFFFRVKNNLVLEGKHRVQIGEAWPLYLYCVMWQNANPGKEIRFFMKNFIDAQNLGVAETEIVDKETILSWIKRLEFYAYIMAKYIDGNFYGITVTKPIKLKSVLVN